MSQYEFFMVVAGVVVAIAMSEIVGGWGRMLRSSAEIEFDWLHFGWSLAVLFFALIYWIGMWPYADADLVYMGQVWFLIIPTLFLVLVAFAITPELPSSGSFRMRDYYLSHRRKIFGSFAVYIVLSQAADFVIADIDVDLTQVIGSAPLLLVLITLSVTKSIRLHWTGLALILGVFMWMSTWKLEDMWARLS